MKFDGNKLVYEKNDKIRNKHIFYILNGEENTLEIIDNNVRRRYRETSAGP